MSFVLVYHPAVESHDLPALDAPTRSRIEAALEQRLAWRPAVFGKRLHGTLKGLWSMRVGDKRVIYAIAGEEVYVLLIGHRDKVYNEASRRWLSF